MADTNGTGAAAAAAERALADDRDALDNILGDFEIEQRRVLLMAVDKAIDKAIKRQSDMLESVKTRVVTRQRQAIHDLRDELTRQQPSMMDQVIAHTLDHTPTSGLLRWILHPQKQQQARECVERLRSHLASRQGNLFRSDFEALLVVYMEYLNIAMPSGSRLNNRIEDFKDALHRQAASTDELSSLAYRVNWACYGVRTIGNARSHDTTPLSDSEMLELCGCFSALNAAMPTLALEFDAVQPEPVSLGFLNDNEASPQRSSAFNGSGSDASMDFSALNTQLRQLAGANGGSAPNDFERLLQLLAAGLNNNGASGSGGSAVPPAISTAVSGLGSTSFATSPTPPPPMPPGYPPLPPSGGASAPPGFASSTSSTSPTLRGWSGDAYSPLRNGSPTAPTSSSSSLPREQPIAPTQAALAMIPSFKFYHERPTELPKESDRTRMAMFARMINHMSLVPKATLCPFSPGHDAACPRSHSYMEVMSYNPLFKRLVCRQPSHYWSSQVAEDENCVCIHVDTGLKWEWLDESRDKRMYCLRGDKCTNTKCVKSHSFEELCWYNPAFKVKKCAIRAHDHIARARGTLAPPLDCSSYHIEVGKNADMRQLMVEDDHVGKPVKLLFAERTHKPLADALEALRYARAHNLNL